MLIEKILVAAKGRVYLDPASDRERLDEFGARDHILMRDRAALADGRWNAKGLRVLGTWIGG